MFTFINMFVLFGNLMIWILLSLFDQSTLLNRATWAYGELVVKAPKKGQTEINSCVIFDYFCGKKANCAIRMIINYPKSNDLHGNHQSFLQNDEFY